MTDFAAVASDDETGLTDVRAAGKAADLIMALARRHAAARPQTLGFLAAKTVPPFGVKISARD